MRAGFSGFEASVTTSNANIPGLDLGRGGMTIIKGLCVLLLISMSVMGCGEKDEEKASQNRPQVPGY